MGGQHQITFCRLLFLSVLLLFPQSVFSEPPHVPTKHIEEQFRIPGDPRTFSRHIFIPIDDESKASIESRELLAIVAGEIEDDARKNGWFEGPSGRFYREELDLYRTGHWPSVYITEAGHWQVLMHMAFAIRWDNQPLPWEKRFLGEETGYLPKEIVSQNDIGRPVVRMGSFQFPKFRHFTELNSRQNQEVLMMLALMRWEATGERSEFKFLCGRESSLVFLRELLHGTEEYQLHKFSRRPLGDAQKKEFQRALAAFPSDTRMLRFSVRQLQSPDVEMMEDFFPAFFVAEEYQKYIANSGVYGHVSDKPKGDLWVSPRSVLFERRLQLPPSLYSFIEGPGMGTLGIRTDIHAVPTPYFETHVLRSLDDHGPLRDKKAIYLPKEEWVKGSLTCATHLSDFEKRMLQFKNSRP